ncbi:hypothetical protein LguiA_020969 [Lonicera macranthoides]
MSGGAELPSSSAMEVDGKKQRKKITFNLKGQIIQGKNEFKARGFELLKTHIRLAFDDWRHVPDKKKEDMMSLISPPEEKDAVFTQLGVQLKTWKKNVRNKYFGNTRESVLAYKDKVPESVQVSLSAWNTFVDREATPEKLAQRCKAKDNRSKKTDAHYLGRTSYAENEEICMSVEKRKPDRVELYVDARKNPKTKLCHPGAVSDVEQLMAIRSTQDESSKGSIETDALTRHFGKDKRGRTRGVGSTVARTKLKATLPIRNELEQMKASVQSINDSLDDLKSTMSHILKVVQGMNPSSNPESGASHTRTNAEVGVIPIVHCSKKSVTGSPSTPTSGPSKSYKLMNLDGSKSIAQVTIVKTAPGSLVHGRPLLPFEVKIAVVKVFPGMGDEPLWKGNQRGVDTLAEIEGGYLVWPKYLMEEVTGDNCMVIVEEPVDCPNVSVIACKYVSIFQECLQHSGLPIWNILNNIGFWHQLTEVLVMVQICSMGFEDEVVNSELEQMAQEFAASSFATSYLPLIALVVQTKYVGREIEGKWFNIRGVNQMDKTLSIRGARISFSLWEVAGGDSSHDHIPLACKDSVAMIFMFDLTSRCTLNRNFSSYVIAVYSASINKRGNGIRTRVPNVHGHTRVSLVAIEDMVSEVANAIREIIDGGE